MAGIGFELRKLFIEHGAMRKIRAYAYATIVSTGTMLLSVALLIGIQSIAILHGASEVERATLLTPLIYALLISMLLASCFQTLLSRYQADMLYQATFDDVIPSLIGASLLLMLPGGAVYGLILAQAHMLSIESRILYLLLFMELIPVWLQMTYISAVKDYRRIITVFATGVGTALLCCTLFTIAGIKLQTALLSSVIIGFFAMLIGFTHVLLRYFPFGQGKAFAFVRWIGHAPQLVFIGLFTVAGSLIHMVLIWFGPIGNTVAGLFRQASAFDPAVFYAFLVTLPANINFVVSVEVNFYQEYKRFFHLISAGGVLAEINIAQSNMIKILKQEVFRLARIQVFFMLPYIFLMPYFLRTIGFTNDLTTTFQILSIGYSAYAVGNSALLLLLYFNDFNGALATAASFLIANAIVTLHIMRGPPVVYGIGLVTGGFVMYIASITRLLYLIKHIDYHIFCRQPLLGVQKTGKLLHVASWLDGHVLATKTYSTNDEGDRI